MQIKSLKISNLLTFEHKDDIEECQEIAFKENDLNLIIGVNGSGKSNFADILGRLLGMFISPKCHYEPGVNGKDDKVKAFMHESWNEKGYRNKNFSEKESCVKVTLSLGDNDIENLNFIKDNIDLVNKELKQYANIEIPNYDPPVCFSREVVILIKGGVIQNKSYVSECIRAFYAINCISENIADSELKNLGWKECFLDNFIGLSRSAGYNMRIQHPVDFKVRWSVLGVVDSSVNAVKNGPSSREFAKICYRLYDKFMTLYDPDWHALKHIQEIIDNIDNFPLQKEINELLKIFFPELVFQIIAKDHPTLKFRLDFQLFNIQHNKAIEEKELSSGQKALLSLIFNISLMQKNSVVFVDELELHLHPQMQKNLSSKVRKIAKERKLQVIATTHSSLMINQDIFFNTLRFYLENHFTKVAKSESSEETRHLLRFLSATNSSKVFFVNKVVMVEGASDEYVFKLAMEYLIENNDEFGGYSDKYSSIEFLDINGKENLLQWVGFLKNLKIDFAFIGDLDNITRAGGNFGKCLGFLDEEEGGELKGKLEKFQKESCVSRVSNKKVKASFGSRDLANLLASIDSFLEIESEENLNKIRRDSDVVKNRISKLEIKDAKSKDNLINDLYEYNLFILKKGELEDYFKINKSRLINEVNEDNIKKFAEKEEIMGILREVL